MTTFYLIRHGESHGNVDFHKGIFNDYGEKGSDLTDLGKEQVTALAKKIRHLHFEAIYSSDLLRAQRTAEIIAIERSLHVNTTKAIRERSFGVNQEKFDEIKEKIKRDLKDLASHEKFSYKHAPDVESMEEASLSLLTFLRELSFVHSGKNVLLVSHGNILRSVLIKLGFGEYDELPGGGLAITNSGYIVLESDGTDFFIKETHGITKAVKRNEE